MLLIGGVAMAQQAEQGSVELVVFDDTNSTPKYVEDYINFYAEFSRDGSLITEGDCTITFGDNTQPMVYSPAEELYTFTKMFAEAGIYSYSVACADGDEIATAKNNVTIYAVGDSETVEDTLNDLIDAALADNTTPVQNTSPVVIEIGSNESEENVTGTQNTTTTTQEGTPIKVIPENTTELEDTTDTIIDFVDALADNTTEDAEEQVTIIEENITAAENVTIQENATQNVENVTTPIIEENVTVIENITIEENVTVEEDITAEENVTVETVPVIPVENITEPLIITQGEVYLLDENGDSIGFIEKTKNPDGSYDIVLSDDRSTDKAILRGVDLREDIIAHFGASRSDKITTDIFSINTLDADRTTIRLQQRGDIDTIFYCEDFDEESFSCDSWAATDISFGPYKNIIIFRITEAGAYAGGRFGVEAEEGEQKINATLSNYQQKRSWWLWWKAAQRLNSTLIIDDNVDPLSIDLGEIEEGLYDLEVIIEEGPITNINFHELDVDVRELLLGIDDVNETGELARFAEVYAIDPTQLNFTNATVTVVAKGTELYKCKEWNFTTQTCPSGNWTKIQDITPGQEYTFTLTPDDPGFGELNQSDFDDGTYNQTHYNVTLGAVVLNATYSSGTYTSDVKDAGSTVTWSNMSWSEVLPNAYYSPDSFDTAVFGSADPDGVATVDGTEFWIVDDVDSEVYHTNASGSLIDQFDTAGFGATFLRGITTVDGTEFWIADTANDEVYHVNASGSLIDQFDTAGFGATQLKDITTVDGTEFWIVDNQDDEVYHTNASGSLIDQFDTAGFGATSPRGITTVDGTEFWIADTTNDEVYHVNASGSLIDQFDTAGFGIAATQGATTVDGTEFWIVDSSDNEVYHVDNVADITFQARSDADNASWGSFVGPDGTSNTYYTNASREDLNVSDARYFQYKAYFETNDTSYTPELYNVTIDYTTLTDTTPPASVSGLANQSAGTTWIYWNWTNPADADFNQSIIYIDGSNVANTSNNFYNATGLTASTSYTITVHTKDTSGNVNNTDVNNTATTAIAAAILTIDLSSDKASPGVIVVINGTGITANQNASVDISYSNGLIKVCICWVGPVPVDPGCASRLVCESAY